jgi:hypothetical protein
MLRKLKYTQQFVVRWIGFKLRQIRPYDTMQTSNYGCTCIARDPNKIGVSFDPVTKEFSRSLIF